MVKKLKVPVKGAATQRTDQKRKKIIMKKKTKKKKMMMKKMTKKEKMIIKERKPMKALIKR